MANGLISRALAVAPLRLWALILSGPPITLASVVLTFLIWSNDHWPVDLRGKQLDFLGWALLVCLGLIAVIMVTLAAVRVRGTGPGGVSVEIDADDDHHVVVTPKEPS